MIGFSGGSYSDTVHIPIRMLFLDPQISTPTFISAQVMLATVMWNYGSKLIEACFLGIWIPCARLRIIIDSSTNVGVHHGDSLRSERVNPS